VSNAFPNETSKEQLGSHLAPISCEKQYIAMHVLQRAAVQISLITFMQFNSQRKLTLAASLRFSSRACNSAISSSVPFITIISSSTYPLPHCKNIQSIISYSFKSKNISDLEYHHVLYHCFLKLK